MLNFITTGAGAVLNVLLNLFFIPIFQVNGAAFATLTSYAVVFVLRALDTHRFIDEISPDASDLQCCCPAFAGVSDDF